MDVSRPGVAGGEVIEPLSRSISTRPTGRHEAARQRIARQTGIFTGTRWTTRTKLPRGVVCGQQAEGRAAAGAKLSTTPSSVPLG